MENISQDENLFNRLSGLTSVNIQYGTSPLSNRLQSVNVDFDNIDRAMNFTERLAAIKTKYFDINKIEKEYNSRRLNIQSMRLCDLIKECNLGDTELYNSFNLSPLMDIFIRQGYINEDYYDYISYFYPGMISSTDRDLLLSMKRQIKKDYTYHIDKIDNFVKELNDYMFKHDAILNNDLLDYMAQNKSQFGEWFCQMMERRDAPLNFLVQYYQLGKQPQVVFSNFIKWNMNLSWEMIANYENEEGRQLLYEAWFKYCDNVTETQKQWLNDNYSFISSRVENIGLQKCKELINDCRFTMIDNISTSLFYYIIEECYYEINTENLCFIVNVINGNEDVNSDNLNLTRITDTHNQNLEDYVKSEFVNAFTCFSTSSKDESVDNILYILNSSDLNKEQKESYLNGQQAIIDNISNVNEEYWDIAIESKIVTPTWVNIDTYFNNMLDINATLLEYIKHFHSDLENIFPDDLESKDALFKELLGTNKLNIPVYRSICKAFDKEFDGYDRLSQLEPERITILLYDGKIAYTENNNEIMCRTDIYPDYLIHNSKNLIDNLDWDYNINADCAKKMLNSDAFSMHEKRKIIPILSEQVMTESSELADIIIDILLSVNDISIERKLLIQLLIKAKKESNKVRLVAQMISSSSYNNDVISSLLKLLGGKYIEIAERERRPVIDNNNWNKLLLSMLEEKKFISSYSEDENGFRVYPPKRI